MSRQVVLPPLWSTATAPELLLTPSISLKNTSYMWVPNRTRADEKEPTWNPDF